MYSYFSRHEVDKKGKDWNNTENPSNGKIMWLAWGGDAGFSWSRKIVNREKNMKKSLEIQEVVEEIKSILSDVVEPADKIVEISDDLEKSNAINIPMGEKVENNKVQKESEDMEEEDEDYESDNEEEDKWDNMEKACWSGYRQEGMKEKGGRMVPNCVPIEKSNEIKETKEEMKKSIWNGTFIK
jgi:dGTP triphosphohydrolase